MDREIEYRGKDIYVFKAELVEALFEIFRKTNSYNDMSSMAYFRRGDYREIVKVSFQGGFSFDIDVSGDSGAAMIRDIVRGLYEKVG